MHICITLLSFINRNTAGKPVLLVDILISNKAALISLHYFNIENEMGIIGCSGVFIFAQSVYHALKVSVVYFARIVNRTLFMIIVSRKAGN